MLPCTLASRHLQGRTWQLLIPESRPRPPALSAKCNHLWGGQDRCLCSSEHPPAPALKGSHLWSRAWQLIHSHAMQLGQEAKNVSANMGGAWREEQGGLLHLLLLAARAAQEQLAVARNKGQSAGHLLAGVTLALGASTAPCTPMACADLWNSLQQDGVGAWCWLLSWGAKGPSRPSQALHLLAQGWPRLT